MRVAIFFDGKNFYSGWRGVAEDILIDFAKLSMWLVGKVGGKRLWGAYYYTGIETGEAANRESQKGLVRFLDGLEYLPGYFVHRFPRRARQRRCGNCGNVDAYSEEKEVDTTMVADMLRLAAVDAFDIAVLVSGDSDHAPAVEGVRTIGKQVYVATWGEEGLSQRVRKAAFDHIDLRDGLAEFCLMPKPAASSTKAPSVADTKVVAPAEPPLVPGPIGPADTEEVFLAELRRAEARFRSGYVGVNYFLKKWKSSRLSEDFQVRNRILQKLLDTGKVETYPAPDGSKALRANPPSAATNPPHAPAHGNSAPPTT